VNRFKDIFRSLTHDQRGASHSFFAVMSAITLFAVIGTFHSVVSHASGEIPVMRSGFSGYCMDDKNSSSSPGAPVDVYSCNDTVAQAWDESLTEVKHQNLCLAIQDNGNKPGNKAVLNSCDNSPSQLWLRDGARLYNPASRLCLDAPSKSAGVQLDLAGCNSTPNETWTSNQPLPGCNSVAGKGSRVACFAEQQWVAWQSGKIGHSTLLNTYTDGAPYEEWCADFVSYVYKEAGYPFTRGEANGWDESNANNVQYMGFTMHDPSSYTPKPGDVAYFDYEGGHVEIVISGGKKPAFIYGNSATIDPSTGNGQMEANTITHDGTLGSIIYYLSPN
jgi:Ricin-type beta-trefoil lectin domain/CHAP domain